MSVVRSPASQGELEPRFGLTVYQVITCQVLSSKCSLESILVNFSRSPSILNVRINQIHSIVSLLLSPCRYHIIGKINL